MTANRPVGSPFEEEDTQDHGKRVKIIEDCRREGVLRSGQMGVYMGRFFIEVNGLILHSPKILLDGGEVIWGVECWWQFMEDIVTDEKSLEELKKYKEEIGKKLIEDYDKFLEDKEKE